MCLFLCNAKFGLFLAPVTRLPTIMQAVSTAFMVGIIALRLTRFPFNAEIVVAILKYPVPVEIHNSQNKLTRASRGSPL